MHTAQLTTAYQQAAACATRVSLPLRSRIWKGQAGEFAGAGTGASLDFHDHRTYVPGDDPRHINWQAYARTGQYTMKLYREEVRPVVDLIMDVSPSMFYTPEKGARSAELLYLITESCSRAGASINVHLAHGEKNRLVPFESIIAHHWIETAQALAPVDPGSALNLETVRLRPNAIRVLISDLLFPGDPSQLARPLTQRQGSGIILSPFSPSEAAPDWDGSYEFVDAERGTNHPHRIEPSTLKKYKKAYIQHFALWKQITQRYQVAFARVPSHLNLEAALHTEAIAQGALEVST